MVAPASCSSRRVLIVSSAACIGSTGALLIGISPQAGFVPACQAAVPAACSQPGRSQTTVTPRTGTIHRPTQRRDAATQRSARRSRWARVLHAAGVDDDVVELSVDQRRRRACAGQRTPTARMASSARSPGPRTVLPGARTPFRDTDPDAQDEATLAHPIERAAPLDDLQRVVVAQNQHGRGEPDPHRDVQAAG